MGKRHGNELYCRKSYNYMLYTPGNIVEPYTDIKISYNIYFLKLKNRNHVLYMSSKCMALRGTIRQNCQTGRSCIICAVLNSLKMY